MTGSVAVSKDGPQYRFVIPGTSVLFNCVEDGSGVFLLGHDVFGKTGFHPLSKCRAGFFRIMLLNSGNFSRIRQRRSACVSAFVPLRVSREHELEGLDISQRGEALQ